MDLAAFDCSIGGPSSIVTSARHGRTQGIAKLSSLGEHQQTINYEKPKRYALGRCFVVIQVIPIPPKIVSISPISDAPQCHASYAQTFPYYTCYRTMHIEHSAADTHDAENILPTAVAHIHLLPSLVAERQSSRVPAARVLRPILAA